MPQLIPIIISTVGILGSAAITAGTLSVITTKLIIGAVLLSTALVFLSEALAPDPEQPRAPPSGTLEGRDILQPTANPSRRVVYGQVKFVPTMLNSTSGSLSISGRTNEGTINPDYQMWFMLGAVCDHPLSDVVAIQYRDKVFTPITDPEATGSGNTGLVHELPGYDARGGRDVSGNFESGAGARYWFFNNISTLRSGASGHRVFVAPNVEDADSGVWTSTQADTSVPFRTRETDDYGNNQIGVAYTTQFDDDGTAPAGSRFNDNNNIRLAAQTGSDDVELQDPPDPEPITSDEVGVKRIIEKIRKKIRNDQLQDFGRSEQLYDFSAVIGTGDLDAFARAFENTTNSPFKMLSTITGTEHSGTDDKEKYFSGKLRGITWIAFALPVRRGEVPPQFTNDVKVIVKGKPVTVSDDTVRYTRNPAHILRDYLLNYSPFGEPITIGKTTYSRIDDVSIEEAATFCSERGYTMSAVIPRDARLEDVLAEFSLAMGGADFYELGGAFTIRLPQVNPAVRNLDPDEVVRVTEVASGANREDKFHSVQVSYVDLTSIGTNEPRVYEEGYFPDRFSTGFFANANATVAVSEETLADEPSLRGRIANITSLYIDNGKAALDAARARLAISQDGKGFSATCKHTIADLRVGDHVMVDLPNSGVFKGKYRIINMTQNLAPGDQDGLFVVTFSHADDRAYDPDAFSDNSFVPDIPTIPDRPTTPGQVLPQPRVLTVVDEPVTVEPELEKDGCLHVGGAYVCKSGDALIQTATSTTYPTPEGTEAHESTFAEWNQRGEGADQKFWLNVPGFPTQSKYVWGDVLGTRDIPSSATEIKAHYMSGQLFSPTRIIHFGDPGLSITVPQGNLGDQYQLVHSGHRNIFRNQLSGIPYENFTDIPYKNQLMIADAVSDLLNLQPSADISIPGFGRYVGLASETSISSAVDEHGVGTLYSPPDAVTRWHRALPTNDNDARQRLLLSDFINWDDTQEDGSHIIRSMRLAKNLIEGGYWRQHSHPLLRNEPGHIKLADFDLRIGYPGGGFAVIDITNDILTTTGSLTFNRTAEFRSLIRVCFILVTLPPLTFLSAETDATNGVYPDLLEWGLAQPQITNGGSTVEITRGDIFPGRRSSDTVKPLPQGATVKIVMMA